MLDFNAKITFLRKSNSVVSSWKSGTPTIVNPAESAYLEVTASGITPGSLRIIGTLNGSTVTEDLAFATSSTQLTINQYESITTLTPSWSSYALNINAVNIQGIPIQKTLSYGPFLCSTGMTDTYAQQDATGTPGRIQGLYWRISILAFEPQNGDDAVLSNGIEGVVTDVSPILFPNFPKGWWFVLTQNPG